MDSSVGVELRTNKYQTFLDLVVFLMFVDPIFTPHTFDVMGVIVMTSCVRLSVCYHSQGRTDKHTDLNLGMEVKWKDI